MRPFIKAGFRIILIWLFIESILVTFRYISSYWTIYYDIETTDLWRWTGITLAAFVVSALVLLVLWWKTDWLVRILTGGQNVNTVTVSTSNIQLMQVGVRIIGIVLIALAIPDIAGLTGYYIELSHNESRDLMGLGKDPWILQQYLTLGFRLVIGLVLLLGTRGIVRALDTVWDKAHMVHDHEEPPAEDPVNNN